MGSLTRACPRSRPSLQPLGTAGPRTRQGPGKKLVSLDYQGQMRETNSMVVCAGTQQESTDTMGGSGTGASEVRS